MEMKRSYKTLYTTDCFLCEDRGLNIGNFSECLSHFQMRHLKKEGAQISVNCPWCKHVTVAAARTSRRAVENVLRHVYDSHDVTVPSYFNIHECSSKDCSYWCFRKDAMTRHQIQHGKHGKGKKMTDKPQDKTPKNEHMNQNIKDNKNTLDKEEQHHSLERKRKDPIWKKHDSSRNTEKQQKLCTPTKVNVEGMTKTSKPEEIKILTKDKMNNLEDEAVIKNESSIFNCFLCPGANTSFTQRKKCVTHLREKHATTTADGKVSYQCIYCKQEFKSGTNNTVAMNNIANHMFTKHGDKTPSYIFSTFHCKKCNYKTLRKAHMVDHKVSHASDKSDALFHSDCQPIHNKNGNHLRHEDHECLLCTESFHSLSQFLYHFQSVHCDASDIGYILYKCSYCSRKFLIKKSRLSPRMRDIVSHLCRAHDLSCPSWAAKYIQQCNQCKAVFFRKERLHEHVMKAHNMDVTDIAEPQAIEVHDIQGILCHLCPNLTRTNLKSVLDLYKHVKIQHFLSQGKKWIVKCPDCMLTFCTRNKLYAKSVYRRYLAHTHNIHHTEIDGRFKLKQCPHCVFKFASVDTFIIHRKQRHADTTDMVVCQNCGKAILPKAMLTHQASCALNQDREDLKSFSCHLCEKTFGRRYMLQSHHRVHHERLRPFPCPQSGCCAAFAWKNQLNIHAYNAHQVNLTGQDLVQCSMCEVQTVRPALGRHMRQRHQFSVTSGKLLHCGKCGKTMAKQSSLVLHMAQHKAATLRCHHEGCGFKASSKSGLKMHLARVHGDSATCCKLCRFVTYSRHLLLSHMAREHPTGTEMKECPHCKKEFSNRTNFENHLYVKHKIHESKRPVVTCEVCGFTTLGHSLLRSHKRNHKHGVQLYLHSNKTCVADEDIGGHLHKYVGDTLVQELSCDVTPASEEDMEEHTSGHHDTDAEAAGQVGLKHDEHSEAEAASALLTVAGFTSEQTQYNSDLTQNNFYDPQLHVQGARHINEHFPGAVPVTNSLSRAQDSQYGPDAEQSKCSSVVIQELTPDTTDYQLRDHKYTVVQGVTDNIQVIETQTIIWTPQSGHTILPEHDVYTSDSQGNIVYTQGASLLIENYLAPRDTCTMLPLQNLPDVDCPMVDQNTSPNKSIVGVSPQPCELDITDFKDDACSL